MAPRARISGGESLDSPMRIHYESSSSDEEDANKPSIKQVLKTPRKLFGQRQLPRKTSSSQSLASGSLSAHSAGGSLFANRSMVFQASRGTSLSEEVPVGPMRSIPENPMPFQPASMGDASKGRDQPSSTRSQANDFPDPTTLPIPDRGTFEDPFMSNSTQYGNRIHDGGVEEMQAQRRKRFRDPDSANSSDAQHSHASRRHRMQVPPKRAANAPPTESAVMEWIDGVNAGDERTRLVSNGSDSPLQSSQPKRWSEAEVVTSLLEENRDNIARASAAFGNPADMSIQTAAESNRAKRDSGMTATTFAPSVFSRASGWTENTALTTPSEMVASDAHAKRRWRDSRDSSRFSRAFTSARSSIISHSSIPFRSRPMRVEDYSGGTQDTPLFFQQELDRFSREKHSSGLSESSITRSLDASAALSVEDNGPLPLALEPKPECRNNALAAAETTLDPVKENQELSGFTKLSIASEGPHASNSEPMSGRPASPKKAKVTLYANRDSDFHHAPFGVPDSPTLPPIPRKVDAEADRSYGSLANPVIRNQNMVNTSRLIDVARESHNLNRYSPPRAYSVNANKSMHSARVESPQHSIMRSTGTSLDLRSGSLTGSDATLSIDESDFDDASSGITDYSAEEMRQLADATGVGKVLQLVLANVRTDVVSRVVQQLRGSTTHAHEQNQPGNRSNYRQGQNYGSATPSSQPRAIGKRPSRDHDPNAPDDKDDGDAEKRRKLNHQTNILRSRFACPFYKRNPENHQRWRSCRGPGWEEVRRVKEHVYRRHTLFSCPRCLISFEDQPALDVHAQSDAPCTRASNPPMQSMEGCNKDQERKLRCRKRQPGETEEDRWAEMYRILFGDDCEVPGPYYDFDIPASSPSPSDLPMIEESLRHLPQRLAEDISRHLRRPLDEEERQALPEIIRNSLQEVMQPFWPMVFSAPSGLDSRTAPPASEQGDSAYGSLEHEAREGSAPARSLSHNREPPRLSFGQGLLQGELLGGNLSNNPVPEEIIITPSDESVTPSTTAWQSSTNSFHPMTRVPEAYDGYGSHFEPPIPEHAIEQPFMYSKSPSTGPPGDPPVTQDFTELLYPQPSYVVAEPPQVAKPTSTLRWSLPPNVTEAPTAFSTVEDSFILTSAAIAPVQTSAPTTTTMTTTNLHITPTSATATTTTTSAPPINFSMPQRTDTINPYIPSPNFDIQPLSQPQPAHRYRESVDQASWLWNWTNQQHQHQQQHQHPHPQHQAGMPGLMGHHQQQQQQQVQGGGRPTTPARRENRGQEGMGFFEGGRGRY